MKDIIVSLAEADIGEHAVAGPKGVVRECNGEVPRADICVCDREVPNLDICESDGEVPCEGRPDVNVKGEVDPRRRLERLFDAHLVEGGGDH